METRFSARTGIIVQNLRAYNVTEDKYVNLWGHYDTSGRKPAHVGPWYNTKEELLADHENYLRRAGWITD